MTVQASYTEDGITKDATWGMFVTIAAPSAPTNVTATQGTESSCVRVNWTAPDGATEYAVYRATANNSRNAQYLENVTVAKYNDTSAIPGVDYWYFIKAKNSSGTSGFSGSANGWRKLSPPESVTASDTLLDKVALEWSEVEGATHYRVYRAESIDGEKTALGNWQRTTTLNDTTAAVGVTYYYFVVAAVDASGSRPSDFSIVEDGTRAVPVTIDHLEIKGDASIVAGGFADYAADAIYTDGHKVENIAPNNWEIVGDGASIVGCRMTAAPVTENKSVVLKATYTEGGKTVTGEKSITIAAVKPVAPRNVAATATAQGVTLSWNAVAGAASYAIYRDGNAVGRVVPTVPGDVPSTTYTDSSAIPGVTYSYTVSASNGAGEGPQSSPAVTATIPLPAPAGVTATTDRTDGVRVDWRRVMDNAPYQNGEYYFRVARATSDNGAKTELGSWTTDTSFLDTSAPVDTPLWYFVRAATSTDGANASDWSAGVTGRVIPNAPQLLAISISGPDKVASSGSAVYSCTAAYDDGMVASIAPSWSASGAAAIDANGKLTAHAVTADADVTVTAAFGGKSATKEVKVLAPVQASASVSNVRVKPRWPFSSLVDIDYTLSTVPEGTRALVTLSGQDNDHDVPLAAKTLTGDAVGAAVAAGEHRLTWDIGADYPGFHAASFDVKLEAIPYTIAAPANVAASQGTSTRGVNLSWNAVEDATGYEIWRASGSMNTADAVLVTNVEAVVTYEDTAVNPGDIYFYWFKTVTQYGTGDFSASVFGYRARVVGTVAFDANGGTASASSLGYTAGNPYGSLPTASRTGYEFDGWFTSATGGSEVTAATPADENIATLYARWTPHTYTIHFDANGGTGTMADIEMTYDVAKALPSNTFTNGNYLFSGWATNAYGEATYPDVATVSNLMTTASGNITLHAIWGIALLAPTNVAATKPTEISYNLQTGVYSANAYLTNYIEVSWSAVGQATAYEIYRNESNDVSMAEYLATTPELIYQDRTPAPGKPTYYWIKAIAGTGATGSVEDGDYRLTRLSGKSELSACDYGFRGLQPPVITTITYGKPGCVKWQHVDGADGGYRIYCREYARPLNTRYHYTINECVIESMYVVRSLQELTRGEDSLYSIIAVSTISGVRGETIIHGPSLSYSATREDYETPRIDVSWTSGGNGVACYEVWRSVSSNYTATVTKIAEVTNTTSYVDSDVSYRAPYSYKICAKYINGNQWFSPSYAFGYWGDWCFSDVNGNGIDLMPLRNVLHVMDRVESDVDGYVSDLEMNVCMFDPYAADLDGNSSVISSAEKAVFTRIQTLNNDKELIHRVIQGDYTYRGMTLAQMKELQSISDAIKELTKNRNN